MHNFSLKKNKNKYKKNKKFKKFNKNMKIKEFLKSNLYNKNIQNQKN